MGTNNSTQSGLGGNGSSVVRRLPINGTAHASGAGRVTFQTRPSFRAGKLGARTSSGLNASQKPLARLIRKSMTSGLECLAAEGRQRAVEKSARVVTHFQHFFRLDPAAMHECLEALMLGKVGCLLF